MDAINAVSYFLNRSIHFLNQSLDFAGAYLKENANAIVFLLTVVYFVRTRFPKSKWSKGYLLSSSPDIKTSNEKKKSSNLQEEIRRVRRKQQEIAAERAKEAEINRKEQKAKERDRKNHIAKEKESDMFGNRLGDGATPSTTSSGARSNGRNSTTQPLRSSNTPSYRPTRRNPNRGGT